MHAAKWNYLINRSACDKQVWCLCRKDSESNFSYTSLLLKFIGVAGETTWNGAIFQYYPANVLLSNLWSWLDGLWKNFAIISKANWPLAGNFWLVSPGRRCGEIALHPKLSTREKLYKISLLAAKRLASWEVVTLY